MIIKFLIQSFFVLICLPLPAQDYLELPLYQTDEEPAPFIRVYPAGNPNGGAVIACPGGGYGYLEMNKEGYAFASWFNQRGITFIVLQYRLPEGNPGIPLADAEQAIRIVRENAAGWGVHPRKVGVMGSSAGGHLASSLATRSGEDARPGFQILLYPVITMDERFTHAGSRSKLLGDNPPDELIELYSNELQVSPQTPPAFIVLSDNDNVVPSENSVRYYQALNRNKVSAEMHVYPTGGHGWGMHAGYKYYNQWTNALDEWLKTQLTGE